MKGKLIVIEGTDCSGKETQCKLLIERLKSEGIDVFSMPFPRYDTPTGAIIGGPILGKEYICDSYFGDEAPKLDPKVTSLYYAADRLYNIKPIIENLEKMGGLVILDRYTQSNMAFQGSKYDTLEERKELFKFIENLEYDLLKLPKPDEVIFLHMPYKQGCILKSKRAEHADRVEADENYMKKGEETYLELAKLYNFKTIKCTNGEDIRSIEDINDELYKIVKEIINGK